MNYYNPYFYTVPTNITNTGTGGILKGLFGNSGFTFGGFLNGTQKILNIANQTIPLVKQVRPMFGNFKTIFRVMNEFKKVDKPVLTANTSNENIIINETNYNNVQNEEGPTFFV